MDIGKSFATDQQKEKHGTWIDAGEGLWLRIARWNNSEFKAFIRQNARTQMTQLRVGRTNAEQVEEVVKQAAAHHVLRDWQNLYENGKKIDYSPEAACDLFNRYPDFYEMVQTLAQDRELFRHEDVADAVGNSQADSNGNSNGDNT